MHAVPAPLRLAVCDTLLSRHLWYAQRVDALADLNTRAKAAVEAGAREVEGDVKFVDLPVRIRAAQRATQQPRRPGTACSVANTSGPAAACATRRAVPLLYCVAPLRTVQSSSTAVLLLCRLASWNGAPRNCVTTPRLIVGVSRDMFA